MLAMLQNLDPSRYTHRTYIISSGDEFSKTRAKTFEAALSSHRKSVPGGDVKTGTHALPWDKCYSIYTVPRARKIHQPLLTTPFSCLITLLACLRVLYFHPHGYPDLILTNGPATSVILIVAALILKYLSFITSNALQSVGQKGVSAGPTEKTESNGSMRRIHVESWARTRTPSLTLRIIRRGGLCDRVLVHWERLAEEGWGEWRGDLMR